MCLTLCDPMDCSLPGSSVNGILQARILEWVAIPFSMGSSWLGDRTPVSLITGKFFTIWVTKVTNGETLERKQSIECRSGDLCPALWALGRWWCNRRGDPRVPEGPEFLTLAKILIPASFAAVVTYISRTLVWHWKGRSPITPGTEPSTNVVEAELELELSDLRTIKNIAPSLWLSNFTPKYLPKRNKTIRSQRTCTKRS